MQGPSAPTKAPGDRRQLPIYPNSSTHHRACNSLTPLPLSSRRLSVDSGLNVTITGGTAPNEAATVLYDNVPGGAGLVAQLEDVRVFRRMLVEARERLGGGCGCDSSCYGCLRSYRNQFAHPYLDRNSALDFLDAALSQAVGPISA